MMRIQKRGFVEWLVEIVVRILVMFMLGVAVFGLSYCAARGAAVGWSAGMAAVTVK